MIDAFQYRALATPLQIPVIYGIDMIHGASHIIGPVLFPHGIGMGATRNPELSYLQGMITAVETRLFRAAVDLRPHHLRGTQYPLGPHL